MDKVGLTAQQASLLKYIRECIESTEVAPTYDEMVAHLGARSKGTVARLVELLIQRGHLVRLDRCARGLGLRRPGGETPANLAEQAARARGDGITVRLPPSLAARLLIRCHGQGMPPDEMVAAALTHYLRGRP